MLLVRCYPMLSVTVVYSNELYWHVLYSRIVQVILGPAESAMSWVYSYSPMMLKYCIVLNSGPGIYFFPAIFHPSH